MSKKESTEIVRRDLSKVPDENPGPVLQIGRDGVLLYANPASEFLLEYWGCRVGQPIPKSIADQIKEILDAGIDESNIKLVVGHRHFFFAVKIYIEESAILYGFDMTEQGVMEGALRESETRLRTILDSALSGIITIDSGGVIESLNESGARIFGYSPDEIRGQNIKQLMPSPDCEQHDEYVNRYLRTGEKKIIGMGREVMGLRKDGTSIPLYLTVGEMFLNDCRYFTGVLYDNTEFVGARKELKVRELQQSAVATLGQIALSSHNLSDLMIQSVVLIAGVLDLECCKILELLPEGKELLLREGVGWKEGLVGSARVGTGLDSQAGYTLISDTPVIVQDMAHEERFSGPALLFDHHITCGISVVIKTKEGPFGVLGVHGIQKKELSSDDANFLQAMANVIGEAIERDRSDKALKSATVAAESENRAKSEFLANMSHEIRTPLNGVIMMNKLLIESGLTQEQLEYARIAKTSGESLLALVNDILDLSKIETGDVNFERLPFNLVEMTKEVLTSLQVQANQRNLALKIRNRTEFTDLLVGDSRRIRQILVNFIGNAIKFTEHGNIYVDLTTEKLKDGMVKFKISVEDTGIGIPETDVDQIWNKFTQSDNSMTRKYEGTGLGLAICKTLGERMGGSVGVKSELGVGSTFWFDLCLPVEDKRINGDSSPEQACGKNKTFDNKTKTID